MVVTNETPGASQLIRQIEVENFRGFEHLEVNGFARINLIAGLNNVGKTALLEALHVKNMQFNNLFLVLNSAIRNSSAFGFQPITPGSEAPWTAWFYRYDSDKTVEISTVTDGGDRSLVRLRNLKNPQEIQEKVAPVLYPGQPVVDSAIWSFGAQPHILEVDVPGKRYPTGYSTPQTTGYLVMEQNGQIRTLGPLPQSGLVTLFRSSRADTNPNELAQLFGQLVVQRRVPELVKSLKVMEPRLEDITTVATQAGAQLYADVGIGHQMPLRLMGEGTGKLASLLVDAVAAQNGVLLIDEIENGFHYSVLENIWAALDEAAFGSNVQLFATTHSLECIAAAQRHFSRSPRLVATEPDFRVFRLERQENEILATSFETDELGDAIDLGLEIR